MDASKDYYAIPGGRREDHSRFDHLRITLYPKNEEIPQADRSKARFPDKSAVTQSIGKLDYGFADIASYETVERFQFRG